MHECTCIYYAHVYICICVYTSTHVSMNEGVSQRTCTCLNAAHTFDGPHKRTFDGPHKLTRPQYVAFPLRHAQVWGDTDKQDP